MSKGIFLSKVRLTLLKCMETVGTTASNLASNAKLKAAEINLENHRREILTNFSLRAFEMWQKGVPLPDPLSEMLGELSETEDRLSVIRAQKYAKVPPAEPNAAPAAAPETEHAPETDTEPETPIACTVENEDGALESVTCELDTEPLEACDIPVQQAENAQETDAEKPEPETK